MVQGYYTLEEAAPILGMSSDELKQLARKREIRSFQDGGTWRFKIQDIQEMVRQRGTGGSDLELDANQAAPKSTDSPVPRTPTPKKPSDEVFGFALADEEGDAGTVNIADDLHLEKTGSSSKKGSASKRQLPTGSDSDVRLVPEGGDIPFKTSDSDVTVPPDSGGPKSGPRSGKTSAAGPKSPRPSKVKSEEQQLDSGVRLVPMDSDSDVRIVGSVADDVHVPIGEQPPKSAADSDIRLESLLPPSRGSGKEGPLTEEINLDEELKKEEARQQAKKVKGRPKAPPPESPKKSPFELSESELVLAPMDEPEPPANDDSSSDFELTPASESSSPLEPGSSDDFKLDIPDDMALVDDAPTDLKGPHSGINLGHPADSGISLEQQSQALQDDSEFELTLDDDSGPKPATPKPAAAKLVESEEESDSSEFELSLDVDTAGKADSDSEFELTLDESGGAVVDEAASSEEGQDIFETDFDVPSLGEESGSEAVAVDETDTDLESPEFELGIGDDDVVVDEDSGSEVVALDEEAGDDVTQPMPRGKKTRQRAGRGKAREGDEFEPIDEEGGVAVDEEGEEAVVAPTIVVQQAPWGILPVAVLLPCVVVMFLVGVMGFELVQSQQGYKPGVVTKTISGLMGGKK